jgi:ureidoglycolate lyase
MFYYRPIRPGAPALITPVLLTPDAFAPFGRVLQPGLGAVKTIRDGAVRLSQNPDFLDHDGDAVDLALDFYDVAPHGARLDAVQAERHPHSAQLFVPLVEARYLVVVWPQRPDSADALAFIGGPGQAVIYKPGIWHHGIVAIARQTSFASLLWRTKTGGDTEFVTLPSPVGIDLEGPAS